MNFNFRLMCRLFYKSLFASRGTLAPLTPKRFTILLFFLVVYILIEIPNRIGFLLDEIFFRDYRDIEVKSPVFIIAFPRSGTTFLQRLLARDEEQFTYMKFWEILFAPSITQKKFWRAVGRIDQRHGSRVYNYIIATEKKKLKKPHEMHELGLFQAEEDDQILFHIFFGAHLFHMFPFKEIRPILWFELALSPEKCERVMGFYKRCVQRHLYVFGKDKLFLSKNPAFTTKIKTLYKLFPEAKIICLVRNPLEAIPSAISFMSFVACTAGGASDGPGWTPQILEWTSPCYIYPLEQLEGRPHDRTAVLKYDNMVEDPEQTVLNIYTRFKIKMSPRFQQILHEEAKGQRHHKSNHVYSLKEFGLTREQILSDYRKIFDTFDFDTESGNRQSD